MTLSLPRSFSAPKNVLKANTVNLSSVHRFQPFHCNLYGFLRRRFVTSEKSAAQIPTLTEIDAMFFGVYGW